MNSQEAQQTAQAINIARQTYMLHLLDKSSTPKKPKTHEKGALLINRKG